MNVPKVKFSYDFARGSILKREEKAKAINEKLFNEMMELFIDCDNQPLYMINKISKSIMPESIFYNIKQGKQKDMSGVDGRIRIYTFVDSHSVSKYEIELKTENKEFSIKNLPTLMHEMKHLLDNCLNPKYLALLKNVAKKQFTETVLKLKENLYYNTEDFAFQEESKQLEKILINKTVQYIKDLSPQDKIQILDYIKLLCQQELSAYAETLKYSQKLNILKRTRFNIKQYNTIIDNFKKKNKILDKILLEVISKTRYENAQKRTLNPFKKARLAYNYYLKHKIT